MDKTFDSVTEDEWNQLVKEFKKNKTPSVSFSKVTMSQCVKADGLALNIDHLTHDAPSLHIPASFPVPSPSSFLCESLRRIKKVWVLDNEKACRIVIDAILTEVLLSEENENLLGFCEVKNDWKGEGFGYTGDVDYMLGTSRIKSADAMDSFLMVVEAKKEWPDSAVPQILCKAGCLLKKRLEAGKNTPVFAVLTNAGFFRFFAIDTDCVVYASKTFLMEAGDDGTYETSSSLAEILRWFTWFMVSVKSISPRASHEDLTQAQLQDSLIDLRKCFGLKNNNKKARFE